MSNVFEPGVSRFMYPSGAGGHWFMNLLYRLKFENVPPVVLSNNYHSSKIWPIHYNDHWVIRHNRDQLYFGDWCVFNFYINYVKKLQIIEKTDHYDENILIALFKILDQIMPWYHQHETLKDHTGFCSYTAIWEDKEKFSDNLESIHDNVFGTQIHNMKYSKDIVYNAIEEFKTTIADPKLYYNQTDDITWLAWCWYLILNYKLPLNTTVERDPDLLTVEEDPDLLYDLGFWYSNLDLLQKQVKHSSYSQCLDITNKMTYMYKES